MHDGHLGAKHCFELIIRLDAFYHGGPKFQSIAAETIRFAELRIKGCDKTRVGYAERLHQRCKFKIIHTHHRGYLLASHTKLMRRRIP